DRPGGAGRVLDRRRCDGAAIPLLELFGFRPVGVPLALEALELRLLAILEGRVLVDEVFDRDALLLDEILDELVRGRFGLGWLPAIGGLLRSRLPAGVGFAGVCGAVGVTGGVRLGERQ